MRLFLEVVLESLAVLAILLGVATLAWFFVDKLLVPLVGGG